MSRQLDGKTVLVTGAGAGLGLVYCQALAAHGAAVIGADLDGGRASAALSGTPGALAVAMDVSDPASVEAAFAVIRNKHARLDGVVNNAALMSALPRRSWLEIPVEEWDAVMAVNLRGPFLVCRAAAPLMREAGGSIVNIASSRVFEGTPNRLHYTSSKAGVVGFTRALAREVGEHRIRVNAVAPGLTLSDTQIESSSRDYLDKLAEGRALAGQQTPQDLVGAVVFLLGDASAFITGQTLVVDGGKVMR